MQQLCRGRWLARLGQGRRRDSRGQPAEGAAVDCVASASRGSGRCELDGASSTSSDALNRSDERVDRLMPAVLGSCCVTPRRAARFTCHAAGPNATRSGWRTSYDDERQCINCTASTRCCPRSRANLWRLEDGRATAPLSPATLADGYVTASAVDALIRRFTLVDGHGEEVNVRLRVVADEMWPLDSGAGVSPLVAAVDMIDAPVDDRSVESAVAVVAGYLCEAPNAVKDLALSL